MQQKVEQDSFNEKRRSKQDLSHSDALGMSRAGEGRPTLPQCSLDARTAPSVLRILTHWFLSTQLHKAVYHHLYVIVKEPEAQRSYDVCSGIPS